MISYCGGEAGAGKSNIIQALITLARLWKRRNTLQTTGFTGISSMMIEGSTMHSLFDINPISNEIRTATLHQRNRHKCIRFFIIDEVSMTSQELLGACDLSARQLTSYHTKEARDMIMGGKHVLMFGDLMQFLPINTPCK
ncbi:DNA helicase Pif1 like protein [Chytridium lagenaria]|nr:DNA helicase Pif1 like protein [Chytridium lagenaria]